MGLFATRTRTAPTAGPERSPANVSTAVAHLPAWLVAVAEGWSAHTDTGAACEIAGRRAAECGISLDEVMTALRAASQLVLRNDPPFDDVQTLCRAWSENTLSHLHQISCADPLTGLATTAHLRTAITDLHRDRAEGPDHTELRHALVVSELDANARLGSSLDLALALTRLREAHRTVFPSSTVARVGVHRVVALVLRDDRLGRRVQLLKQLGDTAGRVWIEGLPSTERAGVLLLDELSRS